MQCCSVLAICFRAYSQRIKTMRTTDETVELNSLSPVSARRWTMASAVSGIMGAFRRWTGGRARNHVDDLNEYGLRDIGLDDCNHAYAGLNRAARQDAALREAHRMATMLAMGTGGR
jgi:hypothetical protein